MRLEVLQGLVLEHAASVQGVADIEVVRDGGRSVVLSKAVFGSLLALRVDTAPRGHVAISTWGLRHTLELADQVDVDRANAFVDAVLDGHGHLLITADFAARIVGEVVGWEVRSPLGSSQDVRQPVGEVALLTLALPNWR